MTKFVLVIHLGHECVSRGSAIQNIRKHPKGWGLSAPSFLGTPLPTTIRLGIDDQIRNHNACGESLFLAGQPQPLHYRLWGPSVPKLFGTSYIRPCGQPTVTTFVLVIWVGMSVFLRVQHPQFLVFSCLRPQGLAKMTKFGTITVTHVEEPCLQR